MYARRSARVKQYVSRETRGQQIGVDFEALTPPGKNVSATQLSNGLRVVQKISQNHERGAKKRAATSRLHSRIGRTLTSDALTSAGPINYGDCPPKNWSERALALRVLRGGRGRRREVSCGVMSWQGMGSVLRSWSSSLRRLGEEIGTIDYRRSVRRWP